MIDNNVFVLMPFNPKTLMDKVFESIREVVIDMGLGCTRSDTPSPEPGVNIPEHVWTGIIDAQLVIADLTDLNPNVFFELGVCKLLHKPIVYISQTKNVPFYLNQEFINYYSPSELNELNENLKKWISQFKSSIYSTPVIDQIARFETMQFVERLDGLSRFKRGGNYRYEIPRGVGNTTFSQALREMPPEWGYDTLSQLTFWKEPNIQVRQFLNLNVYVACRHVTIRRVLMLREKRLKLSEVQNLLIMLNDADRHVADHNREHLQNRGNLQTRVQLVNKSNEQMRSEHLHFAVLYPKAAPKREGFVYEPEYNPATQEFEAIKLIGRDHSFYRDAFEAYWEQSKPVDNYIVGVYS